MQANSNIFYFCPFYFLYKQSLEGISDIRDESDRSGMRIVIEVYFFSKMQYVYITESYIHMVLLQLKRGADPSIVLNKLYRLTALQSSFNCNMVGLVTSTKLLFSLECFFLDSVYCIKAC